MTGKLLACVDCKHHDRSVFSVYDFCTAVPKRDAVRGDAYRSCETERSIDGNCGPEARLYRASWWTRIFGAS